MTVHPELAHAPEPPGRPRGVASALADIGPVAQACLIALGLWAAADAAWGIEPGEIRPALAAVARLVGFALVGWITRELLRAGGALLDLFAAQAEIMSRVAQAVEQIAAAHDRAGTPTLSTSPSPPTTDPTPSPAPVADAGDLRASALAGVRAAIRRGRWEEADPLFRSFADAFPADVAADGLTRELDALRQSAVAGQRDRLDAARAANDPDRIFEIRDAMAGLLDAGPLRELDRELAGWLIRQVQKRIRNGVMTLDVVVLASRVADTFDATPEGASLRAALPTLRRSVGLCARCGKPYTGIADACPACLAAAAPSPPPSDFPADGDNDEEGNPIDDLIEPEGGDYLEKHLPEQE